MAARLRYRVLALDTSGNVRPNATVKFYVKGTASASGSSTSGTPFAGNLYSAVTGGSPISTTQQTNSVGHLIVFSDTPERIDVGVEYSGGANVVALEMLEIDPSDALLGKAYAVQGTAIAPADLPEFDGSKRYAPVTAKIYSQNVVSASPRESFAIIGHNVHQTGAEGYATGVYGLAEFPTGHDALTDENSATGVLGEAKAPSGGVDGAMLRGGNFRAENFRTTTDLSALVLGAETNVRSDAGANGVSQRAGVLSTAVGGSAGTSTGGGSGNEVDGAFVARAKKPARPFKYVLMAAPPSYSHISDGTEGILFPATEAVVYASSVNANGGAATTPVARGVDFRNLSVTNSFFECLNFVVNADGTVTFGGDITVNDDLVMGGTSKRIYLKTNSATVSEHTMFQDANSATATDLGVLPGSAATQSMMTLFNNPAPASGQFLRAVIDGSAARITSNALSGTAKDFYLRVGTTDLLLLQQSTSDVLTLAGHNRVNTSNKAFIAPAQSTGHTGGFWTTESGGSTRPFAHMDDSNRHILGDVNVAMRVKSLSWEIRRADDGAHIVKTDSAGGAGAMRVGFFNVTPAIQQTGGVLTADATYGSDEQDMLNRMWTALRAYGLIS